MGAPQVWDRAYASEGGSGLVYPANHKMYDGCRARKNALSFANACASPRAVKSGEYRNMFGKDVSRVPRLSAEVYGNPYTLVTGKAYPAVASAGMTLPNFIYAFIMRVVGRVPIVDLITPGSVKRREDGGGERLGNRGDGIHSKMLKITIANEVNLGMGLPLRLFIQ